MTELTDADPPKGPFRLKTIKTKETKPKRLNRLF
jgi:hypothetical protein